MPTTTQAMPANEIPTNDFALPFHLKDHPIDIVSRCELKLNALSVLLAEDEGVVADGIYFIVQSICGELRFAVNELSKNNQN